MYVTVEKCEKECKNSFICKYISHLRTIEEEAEVLNCHYQPSVISVNVKFDCDYFEKED